MEGIRNMGNLILKLQNKSIKLDENTKLGEEGVMLDGLQPYTLYNITIKCKSVLGGYWSNPRAIVVTTEPSGE